MGIGISELLVILAIVILVFGTKRLRSLGSDLGAAIKSFRSAVKEGEEEGKLPAGKNETAEAGNDKDNG
ncbi:MAG: twin-arginine translocase TatA/TatE family subunit [Gammaproteobacteria bacterium]